MLNNNNGLSRITLFVTSGGKFGEFRCHEFEEDGARAACDINEDGVFDEPCSLDATCSPTIIPHGCGHRGGCTASTLLEHGHQLTTGNFQAVTTDNATKWTEFPLAVPISILKHTTYYLSVAVLGDTSTSSETIWFSGNRASSDPAHIAATELRRSYTRSPGDWVWSRNANCAGGACVLATKFRRCVTALPSVDAITTASGHRTGCCEARSSPSGGLKAAKLIIHGRNFFPSESLQCMFLTEDGTIGSVAPGTVTAADYTTMECTAPSFNPHAGQDCSSTNNCRGVGLIVSNDGVNVPSQIMNVVWDQNGTPLRHGHTPHLVLFSDLYVSKDGSDTSGDGSHARPYETIQRALNVAHDNDQVVLLPGTFKGIGNHGLRNHGKTISIVALSRNSAPTTVPADLETYVDCEHSRYGLFYDNLKDSCPFTGQISLDGIGLMNCADRKSVV